MNSIKRLRDAVLVGDEDVVERYTKETLKKGKDPLEILEEGLIKPLKEIEDKWIREELFLTDVLLSANAIKVGASIIECEMKKRGKTIKRLGKVIIGTVRGDIHDIGKNIVATMLMIEGFEVFDLGIDVPTELWINKTKQLKADILAMSSLLTTAMDEQRVVIEALKEAGLRDKIAVIIGGAAVAAEWAEKIGADGYGADAIEAVEISKRLLKNCRCT